jgi:hypothetical protein
MTTFPGSPKLLKGAIVALDPANPVASVIAFQYNPSTLTRSIQAQTSAGEEAEQADPLRLKGPPRESISLEVELDATDQLETGDPIATTMGIYPQLAAIEMLVYPKSALVIANTALLDLGTIEVVAPEAPLTLFVWGPKRVLPVRLSNFTIEEEAFDVNLNPTRARVNLSLDVLNYDDLPLASLGYSLFLAHQAAKETMATIGSSGNLGAILGGDVRLW